MSNELENIDNEIKKKKKKKKTETEEMPYK